MYHVIVSTCKNFILFKVISANESSSDQALNFKFANCDFESSVFVMK